MTAIATVKGGFWPENSIASLTQISGTGSGRRNVAKTLAHRGQLVLRELMDTLNGVAPGAAALKALTRITNSTELGGKRTIETVNLINRVTTAADVTRILNDIYLYSTKTTFGASPPVNKDGNPLGTR